MNGKREDAVITEQTITERFGEPLELEELAGAKKENWADHKVPEKKAPRKKSGPKPKFWGAKHPRRAKSPKAD